jgi:hypothetical protein
MREVFQIAKRRSGLGGPTFHGVVGSLIRGRKVSRNHVDFGNLMPKLVKLSRNRGEHSERTSGGKKDISNDNGKSASILTLSIGLSPPVIFCQDHSVYPMARVEDSKAFENIHFLPANEPLEYTVCDAVSRDKGLPAKLPHI